MKRNDAFPSRYISKEDVVEPTTFTIADVAMDVLEGDEGQKSKPVMYFTDEDAKPFILNGTNWLTIEGAYGDDSDTWAGKTVTLFNDPSVMFGKKRVGGVRVRIPGNSQPATVKRSEAVTAFWGKVRELGLDQAAGLKIVANAGGDFSSALSALTPTES